MRVWALLLAFAAIPQARAADPLGRAPASSLSNPFAGDERAAKAGKKLYASECAACHGRIGQGTKNVPPLARQEVRQAEPGALFWVLRNGSLWRGMPSFAHLPGARRWQIITYLQSSDFQTSSASRP